MWASTAWKEYTLLDCGRGEKLEQWGPYTLVRPDPQAIWDTPRRHPGWKTYHARYARSNTGGGRWVKKDLPQRWQVHYRNLTFNIKPMNFKHTGLFPEQAANWDFAMEQIRTASRPISVLNLFAYTGAASVACAAAGADFVGTTMRGYTPETEGCDDIDFDFVHTLATQCPAKVIAEGHIHYPEQAVKALEAGAFALVVGGAITRPAEITARFTGAINAMNK